MKEPPTGGRGRGREEGRGRDGYLFFAPLHDQRMRDGETDAGAAGRGGFSLHRSVDRMLRFMPLSLSLLLGQ